MIIAPKMRGFICTTAHPDGCRAAVQTQIKSIQAHGSLSGPQRVLVIGASTGFGLASRIVSAFGYGADTLGVCFEKEASGRRTASTGWYNTAAFEQEAAQAGLTAHTINGDAFSHAIKEQTIDWVKANWPDGIDLIIYSIASPKRQHPDTGTIFQSTLKTIGQPYTSKTIDVRTGTISDITIEPASQQDIDDTVAVMGGEDWALWIETLQSHNLLAEGVKAIAYTYVGPALTYPIYRQGTIGKAKEDLEKTAVSLTQKLAALHGEAIISVNKALVTQSSAAIPVVPLYISLLYRIMKEKGTHEGCIEQMTRLFKDHIYIDTPPDRDSEGRIRIDDLEMDPNTQDTVAHLWAEVTTDNIEQLSDLAGYRTEFHQLFGFNWPEVNYDADIDPSVDIPSLEGTEACTEE